MIDRKTKTKRVKGSETVARSGIRYGIGLSALGAVLVARTPKGVCAILLGDSARDVERKMRDRFPGATADASDPELTALVAASVSLVERPGTRFAPALDLCGTPFQRRVWNALREVPAGSTTTYSALAERLGVPRAARAVGGACAANPIAVAVPCHRVLRTDGSLSGYRWGLRRKRELLDRERERAA